MQRCKPAVLYAGNKYKTAHKIVDSLPLLNCTGNIIDACCGSGAFAMRLAEIGWPKGRIIMIDRGPWGMFWNEIGNGKFPLESLRRFIDMIPKNPLSVYHYITELFKEKPYINEISSVFLILQAASASGYPIRLDGNGRWKVNGFRTHNGKIKGTLKPVAKSIYERVASIAENMIGVRGFCYDVKDCWWFNYKCGDIIYIDPPYSGCWMYGRRFNLKAMIKIIKDPLLVSYDKQLSKKFKELTVRTWNKTGYSSRVEYLNMFNF